MKITQVDVVPSSVAAAAPRPWRNGLPRRDTVARDGFLRIMTDDGVIGRAHVIDADRMAALVDEHFRAELVGADPLAREYLWERTWEVNRLAYMSTNVVGAVDIALWDIAGQAAGLPVYQLLGYMRDSLPAYASTVTFASVEEYLDVADQCLELGFRAIKLHAWGDPVRDARLALALREHVGEDVDLMFDGSAGWDLADAVYVGRALADAGYRWYEEPMREFSVTSYRWLADRVAVPLLVGEITEGAHMNMGDFIASNAATYVRTSADFKAGITGAMRIAHLADAYGLRAEVHGAGRAHEHLCMAIPNTTYYESLVETNPVQRDPRLTADCQLPAPMGAGLGWNESLLEQEVA